mmetsp:Transcript_43688/g.116751  ORF Transcript_43688/g.116751 Transcript_43688/m.116751 type:complete len:105 (-) Transcript_43688:217-531(-)
MWSPMSESDPPDADRAEQERRHRHEMIKLHALWKQTQAELQTKTLELEDVKNKTEHTAHDDICPMTRSTSRISGDSDNGQGKQSPEFILNFEQDVVTDERERPT